jgi:hypothetical protein
VHTGVHYPADTIIGALIGAASAAAVRYAARRRRRALRNRLPSHQPFARYLIPKQTGLKLDLERYLRYHNTVRAHTGRWTKGRTPEQVLGKAKLWQKRR